MNIMSGMKSSMKSMSGMKSMSISDIDELGVFINLIKEDIYIEILDGNEICIKLYSELLILVN